MTRSHALCVAAMLVASAPSARAESPAPRPAHVSIGGGTYLGFTGASWGISGVAEYSPGGRFGRYGLRGESRVFKGMEDGQLTLGVVYEAAAARPRLQLSLYADAGFTLPTVRPVVGGGVQTHLWIVGPLALVGVSGVSLRIDGTDTALAITASGQLRLAW